ncbi:MAG: ATP synthase F1 subunit epsilon [Nitrospirae bacterium]|nr:ATP synthase F1 subunit epsilon [Nitrospirota bacterium]
MAKNFKLVIVTPENIIFDGEVSSIVAPGDLGYLGILADHAPIITSLTAGKLEITDSNGSKNTMMINGGFMEVVKNIATILVDSMPEKGQA